MLQIIGKEYKCRLLQYNVIIKVLYEKLIFCQNIMYVVILSNRLIHTQIRRRSEQAHTRTLLSFADLIPELEFWLLQGRSFPVLANKIF